MKFCCVWKVRNQAKAVSHIFLCGKQRSKVTLPWVPCQKRWETWGHLEEWGIVKCPEVLRLLSSKRRITHKVYWATGLGEISLEQRHLSISALGKVLREWRKVNVLLLRSCLQGHSHKFQRKWGKSELGSCLFLHNSGDNVGKRSVELEEWLFFLEVSLIWKCSPEIGSSSTSSSDSSRNFL